MPHMAGISVAAFSRDRDRSAFEALVVARAEHFPSNVVDAARSRLETEGMDIQLAYDYWSRAR